MVLVFGAGFLYTFSIKTILTKYISFNIRPNFLLKKKKKQNAFLNSCLAS